MTMTRTTWLTVVGAGIAGLLAAVPAEPRAVDSSTSEVGGTVQSVDRASNQLTLAGSGGELTVTRETQIVKDGQPATLSDVKEGDEVRASYSGAGDAQRVSRLVVVEDPFNDHG